MIRKILCLLGLHKYVVNINEEDMPFIHWNTYEFICLYCGKVMKDKR